MVACSATFVVSYAVLGIASRFARKLGPRENVGRSPRDRFLGGELRRRARIPARDDGRLRRDVVRRAARNRRRRRAARDRRLDRRGRDERRGARARSRPRSTRRSPPARFAARFASRPAVAAAELQGLVDDPNFAELRGDARFWNDVENGNVDAALQRRSFLALAARRAAAATARASRSRGGRGGARRRGVPPVGRAGAANRSVRGCAGCATIPRCRSCSQIPRWSRWSQNGDTLGLLAHPKFRALVTASARTPQP